jgi:hypothetical protein
MPQRQIPSNGEAVANFLAEAQRCSGASVSVSQLNAVVPSLLETGAGSLAWWRIRSNGLRASPPGRQLQQAYRKHTLEAVAHEKHLERLIHSMQAAGLDPIVIKGWATARLYPESGLRPYGDIDLCLPAQHVDRAAAVLEAADGSCGEVDVHAGVPDLADRTWSELHGRSQRVILGSTPVRVLSPEDHLRLLCLHQVRHGMWRPMWLYDVRAALESASDFDWHCCLSGAANEARWVLRVVGLAQRLLGAPIRDGRIAREAAQAVPPWMVETVLWRWSSGRDRKPFTHYLRHPADATRGLLHDGLNPIKAAYRLGICPRAQSLMLPVQVAAFLARAVEIPRRVWRRIRPHAGRPFVMHHDRLM